MICKECKQKISLYLDNELTEEEKHLFEQHIDECDDCKMELNKIKNIVLELKSIEIEKLPSGYCKSLREQLEAVDKSKKKAKINWNWRKYSLVAAALMLVLMVPLALDMMGLGNFRAKTTSSDEIGMQSYPQYGDAEAPAEWNMDDGRGGASEDFDVMEKAPTLTDKEKENLVVSGTGDDYRDRDLKIIKTGYLSLETENYDELLTLVTQQVQVYGGFVEVSETYTNQYSYFDSGTNKRINLKNGFMRILIPQELFYEGFNFFAENGEVVSKRTNEADMTKYFYDMENKVKNLEIQEERLRELFDRAENITEIMQIESELARVRSQIDSYTMELQDISYRADMATITLEIREIQGKDTIRPVDDNLWQRAKESFTKSINGLIEAFENLVVYAFAAIPVILIVLVIVIIVALVIKKIRKNKQTK
ncbi:MAG: DUF4349 domain-containing protein [Dethiosulfatibacter sp.]|nr:DUF4349 domain-containing protein [Dethiosulfatibacter sp.]